MNKIKYKFVIVTAALLLCLSSLSACAFFKSDEELIESRIDAFLNAYNSGDMEAVMECLDSKTRNTLQAVMNIGDNLIGETGFNISLSDMFGLGVGMMSDEDILTISDMTINITGDTEATVDVTLGYKDVFSENRESAYFTMIKEDNDWFIKNLQSK